MNNNNSRHPTGGPPPNNNQGFHNQGFQQQQQQHQQQQQQHNNHRGRDHGPGRGFHRPPGGFHHNNNNNNHNNHHGGRGGFGGRGPNNNNNNNMMDRGGPPPPPPRGGGDSFGPPRGRGFFPPNNNNNRDRFMGGGRGGGPPPMGRGPGRGPMGRGGFGPGRGNQQQHMPPPPPPMMMGQNNNNNNNMGRRGAIPPPPPPRYPGRGGAPPPSMSPMMQAQQPPPVGALFNQTGFAHYPPQTGSQQPPHNNNNMHPPAMHQQQQQHQMQPNLPPQPYGMQQQQQQQPLAGQQPALAGATFAKELLDKAWTEHTAPNSMKYYYNGLTKESTYTKPPALNQNSVAPAVTIPAAPAPIVQKWTEYTEAATGKTYYSDGVQTTWEKPDGYQEPLHVQHNHAMMDAAGDAEPLKKKKKTAAAARKTTEFGSKTEAIAGFKGLLLAKDIQPTTKWNEVVRVCSSDGRWDACLVLTQGERKQALAEYQTKRANELRDREREERMRAKDAFAKLLSEVLPGIESFNPMTSRFMDVRDSLSKNDKFYAVEDEPTRETLFLEFCEEVRKRDDRKRRSMKRDAKDALFVFLREREESGQLTFASTWSSFNSALEEKDKSDPRFQVSGAMSASDRELYFSDFVIELHAAEDEKRRRIRDARRRAEQAQREAFREMLSKLAADGTILPSSRWRNIEDLVSNEAAFAPLKEQDRDAPRELFQDFVDEWHDVYRRDRVFLARLVQPTSTKGISLSNKLTYEEFSQALLDESADSPEQYSDTRQILSHKDPISSARLYFNELVAGVKETANAALRRNSRRSSVKDDSSEDEGEIIEDGEVEDDGK